jgi:hypothetical protein
MTRATALKGISWLSGICAFISLFVAWQLRTVWEDYKDPWGYVLIAFWAVAPPVWFLAEYVFWPPAAGHHDERTRHLHDLARNIWLALVVVLAVTMDLKWPGIEH